VGLSGGIDSAVVAALASEAVGKKKVLPLILPCDSDVRDLQDALVIARILKIKPKIIDITPLYGMMISVLGEANRLAQANLKSRLRMITFYYFANQYGYLVCGTGNKSERMTGYFTKYGDGASDVLPIGDLLKKEVKALARELNIPRSIIEKAPTAGLWPGQTDEKEMGLTYNALDAVLDDLEKKNVRVPSNRFVVKVKKMIAASEHKRLGPCVCVVH